MSWPHWPELTELVTAVAALAWPTIVLILVLAFKNRLSALLSNRKLKSGEILGQKFELEDELNRLDQATKLYATPYATVSAPVLTPPPPGPPDQVREPSADWQNTVQRQVFDVTRQVLAEAGSSPKAALMSLAAQIESELRGLLQQAGAPVGPKTTWHDSVEFLRHREVPAELLDSMIRFRDIRNRIVHGYEADSDDVLRAIDVGLRILNAIKAYRTQRSGQAGTG